MKNWFALFVLLMACVDIAVAQDVNAQAGKRVEIPVQLQPNADSWYDEVVKYFDDQGIATVKSRGMWGVADSAGRMIVEPEFEYIGDFNYGIAPFFSLDRERYGFLSSSAGVLMGLQFKSVRHIEYSQLYIVDNSRIVAPSLRKIIAYDNWWSGAVEFAFMRADNSRYTVPVNFLSFVRNGKFSVMDFRGKILVESCSKPLPILTTGYTAVVRKGKCRLVDSRGRDVAIPVDAADLPWVKNGLPAICIDRNFGFLATDAEIVMADKFKSVGDLDYEEGEISTKILISPHQTFDNGYWSFKCRGKYGLVDKHDRILEAKYSSITMEGRDDMIPDGEESDGSYFAAVIGRSTYCFAPSADGFRQLDYHYIDDNYCGRMIVRKDGKYGVIDQNCNEIIAPKYDDIRYTNTGVLIEKSRNGAGYVAATGLNMRSLGLPIPSQYEEREPNYNIAAYRVGNLLGLVDLRTGREICVPQFHYIVGYIDGRCAAFGDGIYVTVDHNGVVFQPDEY